MRFSSLLLFSSLSLFAGEIATNTSFQGFTGVVNTPNAQLIKEGDAIIHFNNQFDNLVRSYDYNRPYKYQEDYIFGLGFFSFLEIQGRLSESRGYHRDLSANIKLQLPYHHKYFPDIAVGVQDVGGGANSYGYEYLVIDKEISFIRLSAGYGKSDTQSKYTKNRDGVFGGIEIAPYDWISLLADDDSVEKHAAVKLSVPKVWFNDFTLSATVAKNLTHDATSLGFTLGIPLYHTSKLDEMKRYTRKNEVVNVAEVKNNRVQKKQLSQKVHLEDKSISVTPTTASSLESFQKQLIDFGFENVRVGRYLDTIYIRAENTIFDHTELDAIGYILGKLSTSDLKYKKYRLTLLKNNLQTISIGGDITIFKNYIKEPNRLNKLKLSQNLRFSNDFDESKVVFINEKKNSSFFIPRFQLSPGLVTTVGTEHGVFDYILSLQTKAYMSLYNGLTISAIYDLPLSNSKNFDYGGYYNNRLNEDKLHPAFSQIAISQTLKYKSIINSTFFGKYNRDYLGVLNQTNFTTLSGEHAFSLRLGSFQNTKAGNDEVIAVQLGSYRYFYAPLDFYTQITYGKFFNHDVGGQIKFKRFFGETAVDFYYTNTTLDTANGHNLKQELAGVNVSFPLTFRKIHKANYFQVKGASDFSYGLRTTVNQERNTLNFNGGRVPRSDFEIDSTYLDRDRLNSSYIKEHLDRAREAYIKYGSKKSMALQK